YPAPGSVTLPADEYLRLMKGELALYPMEKLRDDLRTFYLLSLHKGEEVVDTRNPGLLRAEIRLPDQSRVLRGRANEACSLALAITNTGDTLWLHETASFGGFVA